MSYFIEEDNMNIEIIYKFKEGMRIFGHCFVIDNKWNCKIIYNSKEFDLVEYFENIDKNYNSKEDIKIELKLINFLTNMSFMFHDCNTLYSFPDVKKLKKILI